MAILLDYKIVDPVLLKAAVIHDLFEDAPTLPGVSETEITRIDADGPAVYALVMEVTIRIVDGVREPKAEYLHARHAGRQPPRAGPQARGSHQQPHGPGLRPRRGVRRPICGGDPRRASCRTPRRSTPTCFASSRTWLPAAAASCARRRPHLIVVFPSSFAGTRLRAAVG